MRQDEAVKVDDGLMVSEGKMRPKEVDEEMGWMRLFWNALLNYPVHTCLK